MKNKKRIGIITVILALLTTGLVYIYLNQATAASKENQVEMKNVVVAITTDSSTCKGDCRNVGDERDSV